MFSLLKLQLHFNSAKGCWLTLNTALGFCSPLHKIFPHLFQLLRRGQLCSFRSQHQYFLMKYMQTSKKYKYTSCNLSRYRAGFYTLRVPLLCPKSSSVLTENRDEGQAAHRYRKRVKKAEERHTDPCLLQIRSGQHLLQDC